jgi:hypothetical protein
MLKMRLGAVPLIEVKMPYPAFSVYRSSQYGKMAYELIVIDGRHSLVKALLLVTN